jgi:urocanate hydratase
MPSQQSIYRHYAALHATIPLHPESGLGGKLLYAGELATNTSLLYAANIAGAASIAASADPAIQRLAIRDSVIDFLVTSLEEALRILKNEIRKHQPVSVGIAIAPDQLVEQMLDRGVLPDLLQSDQVGEDQAGKFLDLGAQQIANPEATDQTYVTWSIDHDFARILPQIDVLAQQAIPEADVLRQRWLRLAPRYLGRAAQRIHGVRFSEEEFAQFKRSVQEWEAQRDAQTGEAYRLILEKSEDFSV